MVAQVGYSRPVSCDFSRRVGFSYTLFSRAPDGRYSDRREARNHSQAEHLYNLNRLKFAASPTPTRFPCRSTGGVSATKRNAQRQSPFPTFKIAKLFAKYSKSLAAQIQMLPARVFLCNASCRHWPLCVCR